MLVNTYRTACTSTRNTREGIDEPLLVYSIYEEEEHIGYLFAEILQEYMISIRIIFLRRLVEDNKDLQYKHVGEIMELIDKHILIDEPYREVIYRGVSYSNTL